MLEPRPGPTIPLTEREMVSLIHHDLHVLYKSSREYAAAQSELLTVLGECPLDLRTNEAFVSRLSGVPKVRYDSSIGGCMSYAGHPTLADCKYCGKPRWKSTA